MVDRTKIDVTLSTIAVITAPPRQPINLSQEQLEQVLRRPLAIGQSSEGLFVGSQRDQIEAIAGGIKINIRDLSGRQDFSKSKVPSVLGFFVEACASQITSYGVNFVITAPCAEPARWVRENILASGISERTKKPLIGGSALLKIESRPKVWNVKLEPGDGERINIDFNAHEDAGKLPNESSLLKELQGQFEALLGLLADLGL